MKNKVNSKKHIKSNIVTYLYLLYKSRIWRSLLVYDRLYIHHNDGWTSSWRPPSIKVLMSTILNKLMMMMVLVLKQHKVTTKYKMQETLHFSLFCQFGEDIVIQNAGQVGFATGQVDFQVPCPAWRVAVGTIFEAWILWWISQTFWVRCPELAESK